MSASKDLGHEQELLFLLVIHRHHVSKMLLEGPPRVQWNRQLGHFPRIEEYSPGVDLAPLSLRAAGEVQCDSLRMLAQLLSTGSAIHSKAQSVPLFQPLLHSV